MSDEEGIIVTSLVQPRMMNHTDYGTFLQSKMQHGASHGFDPNFVPSFLFDFQRALVEWAVRQGRAAIFADCGLGKTPMALVWAENIIRHTNGRALILTPLAVANMQCLDEDLFTGVTV